MPSYISQSEINQMGQELCAGKVITIVAVAAKMTVREVLNNLQETTRLGDLGISATRCDLIVRAGVNKVIRDPAGLPPYKKDDVKPSKTVKSIVLESCHGGGHA